jgi:hypothetical protein
LPRDARRETFFRISQRSEVRQLGEVFGGGCWAQATQAVFSLTAVTTNHASLCFVSFSSYLGQRGMARVSGPSHASA